MGDKTFLSNDKKVGWQDSCIYLASTINKIDHIFEINVTFYKKSSIVLVDVTRTNFTIYKQKSMDWSSRKNTLKKKDRTIKYTTT